MSKKLLKTNFSLANDELLLQETLFHTANGYLGVRGNFEEGYPEHYRTSRGQYINGFYDIAEMKQAEQLYGFVNQKEVMLNVADTQSLKLYADGEEVSMFSQGVAAILRELDMEKGTALRSFSWQNSRGQQLQLSFKRMASFVVLPLFTIQLTIVSKDFTGELVIVSQHRGDVTNMTNPEDPRMAAEAEHYLRVKQLRYDPASAVSEIVAETQKSGLQAATLVFHEVSAQLKPSEVVEDSQQIQISYRGTIQPGETLQLVKYSLFMDSRRYDLATEPLPLLRAVQEKGLSQLYREQEAYLATFWQRSTAKVVGDELLNQSLDFSLYSLLQSAGQDGQSNIAAKGLSGEGYEGHYFWDTEIYMLPFFSLTNPQIAQKLIAYRYSILPAARANARILGHEKGALYPWRTIAGRESSGYYPSGTAQYHINSDIAYSIIQYYLATGDQQLLQDYGAEIIFETARTWLAVGHFDQECFVINGVTGPDEYTCLVNNNYYTNLSAKYHLNWAVKIYQLLQGQLQPLLSRLALTEAEIQAWQLAADKMYLPYSEELQIHQQDDSFLSKPVLSFNQLPPAKFPLLLHYHPLYLYRHQVCKQADLVLAYFLYEEQFDEAAVKRGYQYYEPLTTHDSSLSSCIFSIVANQFGDTEKAYRYFEESSKIDIMNSHGNTQDGIHAANMGGTYLALLFGFGGLRLTAAGLSLRPSLPQQWQGYAFSFFYHGSEFMLTVAEAQVTLRLLQGVPQTIVIDGCSYFVEETVQHYRKK